METRNWYLAFADFEAKGSSPTYEALARAVADSPTLLGLLDELPLIKRQPNLLLASARVCGAPIEDPSTFVEAVIDAWDRISSIMATRATQTNEAARTGTFLPIISQLDGPIALIEVGCSAGLCLYPDRYRISYGGAASLVADSPVTIEVAATGAAPIPRRLPNVVARIGVDLDPIVAADPESLAGSTRVAGTHPTTRTAPRRHASGRR